MDESFPRAHRYARWTFDAAFAGALFIAPLFMGGRGPVGKFVFVVFVAMMGIAWLGQILAQAPKDRRVAWTGAEWVLVGGLLLVVAQLIPLPESVLLTISPHMQELLPVWFSSAEPGHIQIGQWQTISFTPDATRQALAVYLSYVIFFLLIVQRTKTLADAERTMRWLAIGTASLAAIGLAQLLLGNGKFLWVYEHPFRTTDRVVKGPFQNQNHFAHMMALGIGPLLWWMVKMLRSNCAGVQASAASSRSKKKHRRTSRRLFQTWHSHGFSQRCSNRSHSRSRIHEGISHPLLALTFAIGLVAVSVMLTFSRGGFIAFTVAVVVALSIYRLQGVGSRGFWTLNVGTAAVVVTALMIHGYQPLAKRLSTLRDSRSMEELSHGRDALWNAMSDAIALYWRGGTGIGSHSDVYRVFMEKHYGVEFTHGESGYLPLLMESGIGGIVLLACAVAIIAHWLFIGFRLRKTQDAAAIRVAALAAPLAASIAASLAHSTGDFVWYITGPMSWTIAIIALASRLPVLAATFEPMALATGAEHHDRDARQDEARRQATAAPADAMPYPLFACCLLATLAFSATILLPTARGAIPWNEYRRVARQAEWNDESIKLAKEIELLEATIERDPTHHEAEIQLLATLEAAKTEQLASATERPDNASFGTSIQSEQQLAALAFHVVSRAPLEGRGYLVLAQALERRAEGKQLSTTAGLISQALHVRRHDPRIQMIVGKRHFMQGEIDKGFQCWQITFNQDPTLRALLIKQLHAVFAAEMLVERLHPDTAGMRALLNAYIRGNDQKSTRWLAEKLIDRVRLDVQSAIDGMSRGKSLFELYSLYGSCQQSELALQSLKQAIACQPNEYTYRRALAWELYTLKHYASAADAIRWCQARRPDDRLLDTMLQKCVRLQIASEDLREDIRSR